MLGLRVFDDGYFIVPSISSNMSHVLELAASNVRRVPRPRVSNPLPLERVTGL